MQEQNYSTASENVLAGDMASVKTKSLAMAAVQFIALLGVAICAPAINVQLLTGTIVNATLFVAVALLGVPAAIMIGIIPSVVSASTGLLSVAILPMVPFIVLGNALLIVTFSIFRKKAYWKGVMIASVLKFAFLFGVSSFVIGYFVPSKVAEKIMLMMSWPQLYTAISGGVLAYAVLFAMKKSGKE